MGIQILPDLLWFFKRYIKKENKKEINLLA